MILYLITCKKSNKQYVGITSKTLKQRWAAHCLAARHGKTTALSHAIRKYGKESFKVKVLLKTKTWEELLKLEVEYIVKLGTKAPGGYNLTDGGEGNVGYKVSEESRRKMKESSKGRMVAMTPLWRKNLMRGILKYRKENSPRYKCYNQRKTLRGWYESGKCSVSLACLTWRVNGLKWDVEKAMTTPPVKKFSKRIISCRGKTQGLREWSKESGVCPTTISGRLNYGWSVEDAIFTPRGKKKVGKLYLFRDKMMEISAIAKESGIPYSTAYNRIVKLGYSPDDSVLLSIRKPSQNKELPSSKNSTTIHP